MDEQATKSNSPLWKTLLIISACFCLFLLVFHSRVATQDGDSFEYAGIARNLLRTGSLREDLLRNYCIKDQALPHYSSLRANLYVFFLVPFYAVFRESQWTFILPALLGIFFLPLAVFKVGCRMFSERVAFTAALLTLFCPGVLRLYTFMDPGLPEAWQMTLYVLFAGLLASDRNALAGLVMAAAFSIKSNSITLIPAALAWFGLYRRKPLPVAPMAKLFLAALLIVLPFFIRSYVVFGDPFYNEQFMGLSRAYKGQMMDIFEKGDLFGIIFNYHIYNETPEPPAEHMGAAVQHALRVIGINLKLAFMGGRTTIFYIPGVPQVFGLLLIPFIIIGLVGSRRIPGAIIMAAIVFLQVALHSLMAIYSDRYLLCIMPFVCLFAARGMEMTLGALGDSLNLPRARSPMAAMLLFVIIAESGGFLLTSAMRMLEPRSTSMMRELDVACDYISEHSSSGDAIMTYPFFSTHFVCDRPTVPLPYGSMKTMSRVAKKYNAKYIVYSRVWPGDLFPEPPFAKTIVNGRRVSIYEVEQKRLDKYVDDDGGSPLDSLNPVGYFLSNRFSFEIAPPPYKILGLAMKSPLIGFLAYLAVAALFIYSRTIKSAWRIIAPIAIAILILFGELYYMSAVFKPIASANPQLSIIEASLVSKQFPPEKRETLFVVKSVPDETIKLVIENLKPFFKHVVPAIVEPPYLTENTAMFIPAPAVNSPLSDDIAFEENVEYQQALRAHINEMKKKYEKKNYTVTPIFGGVFVY